MNTTPPPRPAVYAADVRVTQGSTPIVGPADLTVGRGDWTNIIGPNGAGKTTLLRAVCGLVASTGRIDILGRPLDALSRRERSRAMAYVPQTPVMPEAMTVEQYVLLGRSPHLTPFASEGVHDLDAADAAIEALDLGGLGRRQLGTLSGGERQRANLARAMAQEPQVLLLDEPTTALDIGHQQEVLEMVDAQRRARGLTVVSTMHDLTLAARYGDNLLLLADGRPVADGPPVQVLTGPHLAAHYGAHVEVIDHGGSLVVVPTRPPRADATPQSPSPSIN